MRCLIAFGLSGIVVVQTDCKHLLSFGYGGAMYKILVAILLSGQLFGCQVISNINDKKALRERCHIPEYAEYF